MPRPTAGTLCVIDSRAALLEAPTGGPDPEGWPASRRTAAVTPVTRGLRDAGEQTKLGR